SLRLPVRSMRPADVRPLVPVEAEPAEILKDRRLRLPGRALRVSVLNPQHEGAAAAAREQPVEQRRTGVADVEVTGGAGGKTNAHLSRSGGLRPRGPPTPSHPTAHSPRRGGPGVLAGPPLPRSAPGPTRGCRA